MNKNKMQVAVSGVAASGKGTVSRKFAKLYGMMYVDAGLIFRFGAYCMFTGALGGLGELTEAYGNGDWSYCWEGEKPWIKMGGKRLYRELINPAMTEMTARVSADPEFFGTFKKMTETVLYSHDRVIADGRSIGSVIMPNAKNKFFITANLHVRAERRFSEFVQMGFPVSFEKLLQDLNKRDELDRSRLIDPLRIPDGAIVIDSSDKTVGQVILRMASVLST